MAVYLRVIDGFVRLQIVPCEGGDRSKRESKQHQQYNSFGSATVPWTSTRSAELSSRPIRQFDPALENFVGICAQGFQGIARIDSLVQIPRAGSQIATALAVRELHFAVIAIDVVHCFRFRACIYKVGTKAKLSIPAIPLGGIRIAQLPEGTNMEAKDTMIRKMPCSSPLPELEVPMINTMVACLGVEHRKLNGLDMRLAVAASRLADDPGAITASQQALRVWNEIQQGLWSHLQIEDELVFSWGESHHPISDALVETLKNERQEMRKLMATLHELSPSVDREQTVGDRSTFAQTLLALARTLDSHVERYDGGVLPSILRALFHK
jgi:hypothetical protein